MVPVSNIDQNATDYCQTLFGIPQFLQANEETERMRNMYRSFVGKPGFKRSLERRRLTFGSEKE
jgi:hypothetical protein